jgi:hypothetical protein
MIPPAATDAAHAAAAESTDYSSNFHPIGNVWSWAYRDGGLPENGDLAGYADKNIQRTSTTPTPTVPPTRARSTGDETATDSSPLPGHRSSLNIPSRFPHGRYAPVFVR